MAEKAIERYVPHLDMRGDRRPFAAMQPHADGSWMRYDAELVRDAMRYRLLRVDERFAVTQWHDRSDEGLYDQQEVFMTPERLDAAIDTAISHSGREQG